MKKFVAFMIIVALIAITVGTVLGLQRRKIELITPDKLISYEDASAMANGYKLKNGEVKKNGNKMTIDYNADPLGSGDNIKVEMVYYSDEYPRESVEKLYNYEHEMNEIAEELNEMGEKAFIAYPCIHIFEKGFYIKITGGSGGDSGHLAYLKELGTTAVNNLEIYFDKQKLK